MGPVFTREMVGASRRWRMYAERVDLALMLLVAVACVAGGWWLSGPAGPIYRTLGRAAVQVAALAVPIYVTTTMVYLPQVIARGLAGERDQGTLSLLLASSLPSGRIIGDVLLAALVRLMARLAATVPLMLLLTAMGGVDPRLVLLTYAGTASLAVFVAGLSAAIAVECATRKRAAQLSSFMISIWAVWPLLLGGIIGRLVPAVARVVQPVNAWLIASSPAGVLLTILRGASWPRIRIDLAWMIALQVAGGLTFSIWAAIRLRPAARRLEEGTGAVAHRRSLRAPDFLQRRRPPVSDDPMLWKELHTGQPRGWIVVLGWLVTLLIFGSVLWGLGSYLALPAFREWQDAGFTSGGDASFRSLFNQALRLVSGLVGFVLCLMVTGQTCEAIAMERTGQTWTSLLATTLEGAEILRAKRLGAIARVAVLPAFLALNWVLGIATGALHPVGVLVAAIGLALTLRAGAAWGAYCSLTVPDLSRANSQALLPVLLLAVSGLLPMLLPPRVASVLEGAASPPFLIAQALVSPQQIRAGSGKNATGSAPAALPTNEGLGRVLACEMLGLSLLGLAAGKARGVSVRVFDRAVDRPRRALAPAVVPARSSRRSGRSEVAAPT